MLCAGRFAVLHSVLDGRKKATAQVQYGKKKKKKKKKSDESSQEQEEQLALQTQKIEKWLSNELHLNMSDIKPAIEAHMTEKCNMRRRAEKKIQNRLSKPGYIHRISRDIFDQCFIHRQYVYSQCSKHSDTCNYEFFQRQLRR